MCSNNTSNNVGVGGVANACGVVGDHDDYERSSLRKAKKKRIPKRGPGVAELEKILREQEKKDGVEKGKIIGGISSSLVPSLSDTYPPLHSSFACSSNSLPRTVTFFPDHNHLGNSTPSTPPLPPVTTLLVNGNGDLKGSLQLGCGSVGGSGCSKGVYIGGSGVFLPEQTLLPITWGSSETRKGEETPKMTTDFSFPILVSNGSDNSKMFPPPMLQKNHGPCHPSMMNLFPQSAISSSSTPSSSSAAGVYHHVEPPSNQKYCHNYTSTLPEEDKACANLISMVGAKRPRANFPVDNWPPAPLHMPHQPPPFHPQISRLEPSSSSSNYGVFDLGTTSRDLMPTSPFELKVKTCVNDHGNPSGNGSALTVGSPTTPLPSTQNCQPYISKFIKQFPFQEMKENTEGLLQSSSSGSEVSVNNKSFFSFLLSPEEQKGAAEATLSLKNEKYCCPEKTGDFIDLNLKL
ncbi:hypothetical protein CRYUN_Cryun32bG0046800 [Craigia yunnanensis]